MKCPRCGKDTLLTFKAFGGACPTCVRHIHPPRMTICEMTLSHSRSFWNVEARRYETCYSIDFFKGCGWHIRTQKQIVKQHVPKQIVNIYYMHYFGERQCLRVKDYKYFNPSAALCRSPYCLDYPKRKEIHELPERSIFESWMLERYLPEKPAPLLHLDR